MLAITTKSTPATATKGLRITAVWGENRLSHPYDHSKSSGENHHQAALDLLKTLQAKGSVPATSNTLVAGELGKGQIVTSRVYVIYNLQSLIKNREAQVEV
jgi:hypothetical protein